MTSQEKLNNIIDANNYGCITLTEWEENYIDSIGIQLADKKELSWKQTKCLNKIWEKIC